MKAIINILKNSSSVTDLLTRGQEGIFIGVAYKNAGKAYLTVNEDVIEPWSTKDDGADTAKVEYTIRVYAADSLAAWNLANAVEAQLDVTTPGIYNNQGLLGSRLTNREQLDYVDSNRDEFGWELIFDTIVTDRSSASDSFTAITAFSYSNNGQTVSSGNPITAMVASVTGDVSYYVVDANDGIISGLSLNTSTGQITGTPSATGSFDVVAVGKNGSSVGVVAVSVTVSGGTAWTPSDLTNFASRVRRWFSVKDSNTSSYEGATNVDQLNDKTATETISHLEEAIKARFCWKERG